MLNLLYTSTKAVVTTGDIEIIYVPNVDAFYLAKPVSGSARFKRMYRDGTVLDLGDNLSLFDIFFDNIATQDGVVVTLTGNTGGNIIDRIAWAPNLDRPIANTLSNSVLDKGTFLLNATGSLKYYAPFGGGYRRYDEATGALEETVVITASFTIDIIHFMKDQELCMIDKSQGKVFFHDVSTEVTILETSIEPCRTAAFDTTYQNVVSIRLSDRLVQVYDARPKAFKLGPLTASPNLFERYGREDLSVQVLGSDDEPIRNFDLRWDVFQLENVSNSINTQPVNTFEILAGSKFLPAKGVIEPTFSKTDGNGIATAVYCPPGLDWVFGDQEVIIPVVRA